MESFALHVLATRFLSLGRFDWKFDRIWLESPVWVKMTRVCGEMLLEIKQNFRHKNDQTALVPGYDWEFKTGSYPHGLFLSLES